MAEKMLNTRIALKYDTYANWTLDNETTLANKTGANFVLLKGEIGICEIPSGNANATTAPTVLFKVGDGTSPFKSLKWASALAADVHNWAKASEVKRDGKKLVFVGGIVNADGTRSNLEVPFDYVTLAEVKEITDDLTTRIANVEAKFSGDASVEGQISALGDRLDTVEGVIETLNGDAETAGSIAKAVADSAAVTKTAYEAYADQAEADALASAKAYVDGEGGVKQGLAAHLADKENPHEVTKAQVGLGNVDNKSVADIKTEFTGAVAEDNDKFVTGGAVHAAVTAAQAAAEQKVTDLTNGQVATNAQKIAENTQAIADEATARDAADKEIINRFAATESRVNAFFDGAAEDSEGLNDALDKLVDIQNYLNGEGSGADGLMGQVSANAQAIEDLDGRMDEAEEAINEHAADFAAYQETITNALAGKQDVIPENTYDAYGAAEAVKTYVDSDFKNAVESYADGKANEVAQAASTALSGAVETLNAKDAELQGAIDTKVSATEFTSWKGTHETDHAKSATAITEEITNAVAAETSARETAISSVNTKIGTVEGNVTDLTGRVAAIEADYLTAADVLILNCGDSEVE